MAASNLLAAPQPLTEDEPYLPTTGRHFATCAGFLRYAIHEWMNQR